MSVIFISNTSGKKPTVNQLMLADSRMGYNQADGILYVLRIVGNYKTVVAVNGTNAPVTYPAGDFKGTAGLSTNPGTPSGDEWWTATQVGVYANFGGVEVTSISNVLNYIKWNQATTSWSVVTVNIPGINNSFSISIFKQGSNGIVFPQRFKWPATKVVTSVQLLSNSVSISVTIGSTTYDQSTLVGVTLAAGIELVINDIIVQPGFDNANAIIVF